MRREYRDRASGNRIKWFINYFLLFVLSVTVLFQGLELWSGNKPSEWGKHEEQAAETVGGMVISPDEGNGVSLTSTEIPREAFGDYGIMTIAESAKQVKATVTPAGAEDAVLDWSIAFKDPASSWASGKSLSDYVTIAPTSDGALTANVTCKQAFGEQVIITAAIRGNASVKGTGTVDYQQKFEDSTLKFSASERTHRRDLNWTSESPITFPSVSSYEEFLLYYSKDGGYGTTFSGTLTILLSDCYTMKAEISNVTLYYEDTEDVDNHIFDGSFSNYRSAITNSAYGGWSVLPFHTKIGNIMSSGSEWGNEVRYMLNNFDFRELMLFEEASDEKPASSFNWDGFISALKMYQPHFGFTVTAEINGEQIKDIVYFEIKTSSFTVSATGVEVEKVVF